MAVIARSTTKRKRPAAGGEALLALTLKVLEDGKAEDVVVIDLAGKTDIADYMVIATGRSQRQVAALADHLSSAIKTDGHGRPSVEGLRVGDWVLIDAGDVLVHLFRPDVRDFYQSREDVGRGARRSGRPRTFRTSRLPGESPAPALYSADARISLWTRRLPCQSSKAGAPECAETALRRHHRARIAVGFEVASGFDSPAGINEVHPIPRHVSGLERDPGSGAHAL